MPFIERDSKETQLSFCRGYLEAYSGLCQTFAFSQKSLTAQLFLLKSSITDNRGENIMNQCNILV